MKRVASKTIFAVCLLLCISLCMAACGGTDPLVGTWKDTNEDGLTLVFTQDKKFEISSESGTMLTGTYEADSEVLQLHCDQAQLQSGPWSIQDNLLTLTLNNSVHQYERQTTNQ